MAALFFIDKIADILIRNYSDTIHSTIIVLPNKRAKVFLVDALKNKVQHNILSPKILSIEDFVADIATKFTDQ